MRVCEFWDLGIFWGCPLGTGMAAGDDPSFLASVLDKRPRLQVLPRLWTRLRTPPEFGVLAIGVPRGLSYGKEKIRS